MTRDHTVELWTSNGDKQTRMTDADEASRLEREPFRGGSNIDTVRVTLSRGECE